MVFNRKWGIWVRLTTNRHHRFERHRILCNNGHQTVFIVWMMECCECSKIINNMILVVVLLLLLWNNLIIIIIVTILMIIIIIMMMG